MTVEISELRLKRILLLLVFTLALLWCYVLLLFFNWFLHGFDCDVDVDRKGEYSDSDTPVLQLTELSIEKEHIEQKLVHHLQVTEHL